MGLLIDTADRTKLFGLERDENVRALRPVLPAIMDKAERTFLARYAPIAAVRSALCHVPEIFAVEREHFAALLAFEFDPPYFATIDRLVAVYNRTGNFDLRAHANVAGMVIEGFRTHLLDGRIRRKRAAVTFDMVSRLVYFDLANIASADTAYNLQLERERRGTVERAVAGFSQSIERIVAGLQAAANVCTRTSHEVETALAQTDAQSARSTRSAQDILTSVDTTLATMREVEESNGLIGRESSRGQALAEGAQAAIDASEASLGDLTAVMDQIEGLTASIARIATQTNLLALNATIEAARAGEAGRGFSVVAGEVKALANETAAATVGIHRWIKEVAVRKERVVDLSRNAVASIAEAATAAGLVTDAVGRQEASANAMTQAFRRSAEGGGEVAEAVAAIGSAISVLAAQTRALLAASADLSANADDLKGCMATFSAAIDAA